MGVKALVQREVDRPRGRGLGVQAAGAGLRRRRLAARQAHHRARHGGQPVGKEGGVTMDQDVSQILGDDTNVRDITDLTLPAWA